MPKELARLTLPKVAIKRLESSGVYCQTWVTVERQSRLDRWVLRGVESGGSTRELGRYISFFSPGGDRLPWLQRLDRIGVNGVHAVVVAPELISVEMARIGQTYQLLIARHRVGPLSARKPSVESTIVFRGVDGQLPDDLLKQGLTPEFFTRAGEVKPLPNDLVNAVAAATAGVSCVNCRHCHGLIEKVAVIEASEAVDAVAVAT
ncbi:MAG: hypothetical protein LC114_22730 [Bryobacterales bacterium]|jgi:hypothetical protein|nr:hypothetical protein [Bryobacterales bacterium]